MLERILLEEDDLNKLMQELDVEIQGETGTHLLGFCPFHPNKETPAFNISKVDVNHPWRCWSPNCSKTGILVNLISEIKAVSPAAAYKQILRYGPRKINVLEFIKPPSNREYEILDTETLNELDTDPEQLGYMVARGYTLATLAYFGVGFEDGYIVVPVWDEKSNLVGFTCRATFDSNRKYLDTGLPKKYILFNLQNAIKHDTTIIVEGPLDAMKVHQAGYPNVVATMMGTLSNWQAELIQRNFNRVTIFTDNDDAGRTLGEVVAEKIPGVKVYWAKYPEGIKDPGQLDEAQIQQAINNNEPDVVHKVNKAFRR